MIGPKVAIQYDVPLVFYGENEAEYGNPIADNSTAVRSSAFWSRDSGDLSTVFLGGVSGQEIIETYKLQPADLAPYLPPTPDQVARWTGEVRLIRASYRGPIDTTATEPDRPGAGRSEPGRRPELGAP